jgi:hypothetical protein
VLRFIFKLAFTELKKILRLLPSLQLLFVPQSQLLPQVQDHFTLEDFIELQ